jgi:hypothetical protein
MPSSFCSAFEDISARKQAETQLDQQMQEQTAALRRETAERQ